MNVSTLMPKCFVIMGSYRSGTSLLSRILKELGVSTGPNKDLYDPSSWNPLGYFQRADITEFNTQMIINSGGTLTEPKHPRLIFKSTKKTDFQKINLTWTDCLTSFLIKDPRFCFTLFTWYSMDVFSKCDLFIIRITRNVEKTAASAIAHYDVKHYCKGSIKEAEKVTSLYNEYAQWHCDHINVKSFHVIYEELIDNPERVINNLALFIGTVDKEKMNKAIETSKLGKSLILTENQ